MRHKFLTSAIFGVLVLGTRTAFPGTSDAALENSAEVEAGSAQRDKSGDGKSGDDKPGKKEAPHTSATEALGAVAARASLGASQESGAAGQSAALTTPVGFGGHSWFVKSSTGTVGPGPNRFAEKNASVDTSGNLHLRVTKDKGKWYSSEIINTASLGYGTYRWTATTDLSNLDRNVVLGLFTWNDLPDYANREIDIEVARWGSATDPTNAQFVVQPYGNLGHLRRYAHPGGGPSTLEFTWSAGRIDYLVRQGSVVVDSWSYIAPDVPVPGGEAVRMNLWQYQGLAPANGQPVEVVFSNFDYCAPGGVCQ